jgi:hypothetical protein
MQYRRDAGQAGTNYRDLAVRRGARAPTVLHNNIVVFLSSIIICRLYKLTISDQAQITLQLRVSLSRFSVKYF